VEEKRANEGKTAKEWVELGLEARPPKKKTEYFTQALTLEHGIRKDLLREI